MLCYAGSGAAGAPLYPDDGKRLFTRVLLRAYIFIARVSELATFRLNLHLIPASQFKEERGKDGRAYWVIRYTIEVIFSSGSTKFEMVQDGKNYGEVEVEWAWESG